MRTTMILVAMALTMALSMALSMGTASAQQSPVMGVWRTESGNAQIRIGKCADAASGPVCGAVVALASPTGPDGKPVAAEQATDWRNSDPALRARKVLGTTMLWGFKAAASPGSFEGGQIYNGNNGKTYSANMTLLPDGKLQVRGYVGTPLFGESQVWTRVD